MGSKLKVGILVVLMIASSAALAASASTTVSMDRSSNVDVVDDSNGLISLESGTSSGVVSQNASGALAINFAQGSATGVNTASTFEVGNQSSPTTSYAFNLTNQDATSHDVTLDYVAGAADSDADSNLQFQVYNSTGSSVGTVDEEGATVTHTLASGEQAYVVIVVDTHGLTNSDDLSGTLTIDA